MIQGLDVFFFYHKWFIPLHRSLKTDAPWRLNLKYVSIGYLLQYTTNTDTKNCLKWKKACEYIRYRIITDVYQFLTYIKTETHIQYTVHSCDSHSVSHCKSLNVSEIGGNIIKSTFHNLPILKNKTKTKQHKTKPVVLKKKSQAIGLWSNYVAVLPSAELKRKLM